MSRTTAIADEAGRPIFASEGAVAQEGSKKVARCNECGREVVWCKSSRTGRFYLVNVQQGHLGARFYAKHWPHRCEETLAALEGFAEAGRREEEARAWTDRLAEAQRAFAAGEISRDEMLAIIEQAPEQEEADR